MPPPQTSSSARNLRENKRNLAMSNPTELIGKTAPKFSLPSSTGDVIGLDPFKGDKTVVLYFYPRADTPGCTKEACGFRDALADYDRANIAVLGISPDEPRHVQKFAQKFHLN